MSDFVNEYRSALSAFRILTGEVDKAALAATLRTGLVSLADAASKMTIREVATATGESRSKVERDARAGRVLAQFPKADPKAVKMATDILTAGEVDKCLTASNPVAALTAARKAKAGEKADKRKARPADAPDTGEGEEGEEQTPAPAGRKAPAQVTTIAEVTAWLKGKYPTRADLADLEALALVVAEKLTYAKNNRAAA